MDTFCVSIESVRSDLVIAFWGRVLGRVRVKSRSSVDLFLNTFPMRFQTQWAFFLTRRNLLFPQKFAPSRIPLVGLVSTQNNTLERKLLLECVQQLE